MRDLRAGASGRPESVVLHPMTSFRQWRPQPVCCVLQRPALLSSQNPPANEQQVHQRQRPSPGAFEEFSNTCPLGFHVGATCSRRQAHGHLACHGPRFAQSGPRRLRAFVAKQLSAAVAGPGEPGKWQSHAGCWATSLTLGQTMHAGQDPLANQARSARRGPSERPVLLRKGCLSRSCNWRPALLYDGRRPSHD